ncbi:LacI family transcriptional regulator [Clostridiaceae bacterium]|nr:LacI family transcriptional regulator [Clostridiaceae bacterium]RKI08329.1 LacI family transcriptional regulator [bacterium 1XD21-70]
MASKVTIQDIADALGVSRNTVSKAINNTGVLAAATRDKVLKKAQEMGYKQFSYLNIAEAAGLPTVPEVEEKHEIALFLGSFIGGSHFASTMLDKFQKELSQLGYSLIMYRVTEEEMEELRLPVSFRPERIAGIACVEVFDHEYCRMLCRLNLPLLFVDSPADGFEAPLEADLLYMDNRTEIYRFVKEMVQRGKKRIGFAGPYMHCQSFYERYMNYRNAMHLMGLPCPEEYCLIEDKHSHSGGGREDYHKYLAEHISRMEKLPDVFICANDATAVDMMQVLHSLDYSIPGDVYLCGFDDSPESRVVAPPLTTIHIHSQDIGLSAVQLLVSRIKEPSLNYRTVYVETNLIFRESTEG